MADENRKISLRKMTSEHFPGIFKRIKADFAPGEYPPYRRMLADFKAGRQTGYILFDGERQVAYAFCIEDSAGECVLLSFLAVYDGFRGLGYGSALLGELSEHYGACGALIVEVERTADAQNENEYNQRLRRVHYYERAGFQLLKGVDYAIWGIPMNLMIKAQRGSGQDIAGNIEVIMHRIYYPIFGERYIHKMQIGTSAKMEK